MIMISSLKWLLIILGTSIFKLANSTAYYGPIRIAPIFNPITLSSTVANDVVSSAIVFYEKLLNKMNTIQSNTINFPGIGSCTDCDFLLIVKDSGSGTPTKQPEIKNLQISGNSAKKERAAEIDFNSWTTQTTCTNYQFKKLVDSVVHGILQVIAFHSEFFQSVSNQYANPSDYPRLTNAYTVKYRCPDAIQQMPVDFDPITNFFYWKPRYALSDIMTKDYDKDEPIWSFLNHEILKDMTYFISSVDEQMKDQIVLTGSCPQTCNLDNKVFCTGTPSGCTLTGTAKSTCQALPSPDSACKAQLPAVDSLCNDSSLNETNSAMIKSLGTYEYYGADSKCFTSDIQLASSIRYSLSNRCYKYACNDVYTVTIYLDTSDKGNISGTDTISCTVAKQGTTILFKNSKYYSAVGITCPSDNKAFCTTKPRACKNFCSKKGVCANSKCYCLAGYFGDDCSCLLPNKYQENGVCVAACSTGNPDSANICQPVCQTGYFKSSGVCTICNSNCKTCSGTDTNCLTCADGSILVPNNTCVVKPNLSSCPSTQFKDPSSATTVCLNCSASCLTCFYQSTFCMTCAAGKFISGSHTCDPCTSNCASCTSNTVCKTCSSGFYLSLNKDQCVSTCATGTFGYSGNCVSVCPDGYFPNAGTSICDICDQNCYSCATTATNCTACHYYQSQSGSTCTNLCPSDSVYLRDKQKDTLWEFKCVLCSKIANCLECLETNDYCTKCQPNFYLYGSKCLGICPSGLYANTTTQTCEKCDTNCLTCSSSAISCSSCESSLYLKIDACVTSCGSGYTKNSSTMVCELSGVATDDASFETILKSIQSLSILLFIALMI